MVAFPTVGQDPWGGTLNTALAEVSSASVLPSDHGLIAWTYSPNAASGTVALSNAGVMQLSRVQIRVAATITNLIIGITSAGATLTAGQSFAALYNSSGTRVGVTADQSGSWTSTGVKTMALTAPFAATAGFYWVATICTGTTAPTVLRATQNTNAPVSNLGTTASTAFFATQAGPFTTMPASITPASGSLSANTWWAGVS